MKNCLCVISTKNPTAFLIININMVKLYYPEFDIVVVDSDSTNKTFFNDVPSDVIVEFCQNKNFELGAWSYAFNKYNNYQIYMFIQDSLIPKSRIPDLNTENFINNTLYSFHYNATISAGGYFDELVNIYKGTHLSFISELNPDTLIIGTAHTSFITNKDNVNTILQLENVYIEKNIVKNKIHSWLSERTGGLVAEKNNNIRIDISNYFNKINMKRDY